MYRERFSTSAVPINFPGALVQLTRPKQMFVEHVVIPNHAAIHRMMMMTINDVTVKFRYNPGSPSESSGNDSNTLYAYLYYNCVLQDELLQIKNPTNQ